MCNPNDLEELGIELTPAAANHLITTVRKVNRTSNGHPSKELQTADSQSIPITFRKRPSHESSTQHTQPKRAKKSQQAKEPTPFLEDFHIELDITELGETSSDNELGEIGNDETEESLATQSKSTRKGNDKQSINPTKIPKELSFGDHVLQITLENVSSDVS